MTPGRHVSITKIISKQIFTPPFCVFWSYTDCPHADWSWCDRLGRVRCNTCGLLQFACFTRLAYINCWSYFYIQFFCLVKLLKFEHIFWKGRVYVVKNTAERHCHGFGLMYLGIVLGELDGVHESFQVLRCQSCLIPEMIWGSPPFPATNVGESLTNIPWNRGKWWWVKPCGILFQRQVARGPKPPVRPGRSCVVSSFALGLGSLPGAPDRRVKNDESRVTENHGTFHVVPRFLTGWRFAMTRSWREDFLQKKGNGKMQKTSKCLALAFIFSSITLYDWCCNHVCVWQLELTINKWNRLKHRQTE